MHVYAHADAGAVYAVTRAAARDMFDFAARDLGLSGVILEWFDHETPVDTAERAAWPESHDVLTASGATDMMRQSLQDGRSFRFAADKHIDGYVFRVAPNIVWIRSSLSPVVAAMVVAHELRHVHQSRTTGEWHARDDRLLEMDANEYAESALLRWPALRVYAPYIPRRNRRTDLPSSSRANVVGS